MKSNSIRNNTTLKYMCTTIHSIRTRVFKYKRDDSIITDYYYLFLNLSFFFRFLCLCLFMAFFLFLLTLSARKMFPPVSSSSRASDTTISGTKVSCCCSSRNEYTWSIMFCKDSNFVSVFLSSACSSRKTSNKPWIDSSFASISSSSTYEEWRYAPSREAFAFTAFI